MKHYIKHDPWNIIEDQFYPEFNRVTESLCSLGNGRMGQRANFEEDYSGDSLQGSYIAGVYYPDKTRVGWWKNGYPEYFAKVLNSANWIGIHIKIDGETLDLANCTIEQFTRTLHMKEGYLERAFIATLKNGKKIAVNAKRFLSLVDDETGAICYQITPLNFDAPITIAPYIDFDIENEDSNYHEKFWEAVNSDCSETHGFITAKTKKPEGYAKDYESFFVTAAMQFNIEVGGESVAESFETKTDPKYIESKTTIAAKQDQTITIYKYASLVSSENHDKENLNQAALSALDIVVKKGFEQMLSEQIEAWADKWAHSDVVIEGDVAAQQGIRFNIFQLNQTYTGEDARLNIGPKGFTGEVYGGSTYWDTEAYCLPFYLSTASEKVSKNLLFYRYKHLDRAIENAEKLGFTHGAALYPMVTMNGEECHNEWEITFEEIHRNGAIAYAIDHYIRYTGDNAYLKEGGLEVLIGIARFWAQRFNWSEYHNLYVMLGVTGPNEYENNVNNNFYTNKLAIRCLEYAIKALKTTENDFAAEYNHIIEKTQFDLEEETAKWQHIIDNVYYPRSEEYDIYLQQDGYLDKEQLTIDDLDPALRPIKQHWSWDRILRSCFIKQADTLQGIYIFEDQFDTETIRRHFDFYEPRTVHESSLSPCVHSILAARLGYKEKALEMYLRTARLDLDDYNNDSNEGCHITSMAGSWMSVVQGFGGMRLQNNQLHFNPFLPEGWQSYAFKLSFRGQLLNIKASNQSIIIENLSDQPVTVMVYDSAHTIAANNEAMIDNHYDEQYA